MKKSLILLLALVMIMALTACGGGSAAEPTAAPAEAPAAEAAAPTAPEDAAAPAEAPAEAPAGDASGEPSGEGSGEPTGEGEGAHNSAELMEPTADYSKDLEGYKAYAMEALRTDANAPADIVADTLASLEAATDPTDAAFTMLTDAGRILSYEDFLAF